MKFDKKRFDEKVKTAEELKAKGCGRDAIVWVDGDGFIGMHFEVPGKKVGDEVTLADGKTIATVLYNAGNGA